MSHYVVIFSTQAAKQMSHLPATVKSKIDCVLDDVLAKDPFSGKALKADLKGLYSYRVGDYRIVYSVIKHRLIIQVVKVMHRREIYR